MSRDDDDQRRSGSESVGSREARSQRMRDLLAQQGIELDTPKASRVAGVSAEPPTVDRGRIRAILLERGARADQIDWMTASCPSIEAAMAFIPTRRG